MRENLVRGSFSFLAAAVTLGMAQEWMVWAVERREVWRVLPAAVLVAFSLYESAKVWERGEHLLIGVPCRQESPS